MTSILTVFILVFSYFFIFKTDLIETSVFTLIMYLLTILVATILLGNKLIFIPKRIYNYINYNFERTCYAIVAGKYNLTVSDNNNNDMRVNLQINENEYIKDVYVELSTYRDLECGDRVIVVSFDGYTAQIIIVEDEVRESDFARENFKKEYKIN